MLVARFNCPLCDAVLKPTSPQPAGKRIKCPRCAKPFAIPSPEEEEVEEIEEVEEVEEVRDSKRITNEASARRKAVREEDDEEDRPSRKRSSRRDDADEEDKEDERPRKKRKPAKKAKRSGSGLKIALFVGLGVFLLTGLGVGGYFLFSAVSSGGMHPQIRAINDATAVLAGVKDQASAQAAKPQLIAIGNQLREQEEKAQRTMSEAELRDLPRRIQQAQEEAQRNPAKVKADVEKFEKQMKAAEQALENLKREGLRVYKVPGGKESIEAFFDAWGFRGQRLGMLIAQEAKAEQLAEERSAAFRPNFAKVQVGMTHIQVITLIGPASKQENNGNSIKLIYPFGQVELKNGKVVGKSN